MTTLHRRAALALLGGLPAARAFAQPAAFPSRPIRMVMPYAPGGPMDDVTRTVATELGSIWGQNVVVENRSGAGGNIGSEAVARATPDGYTLLVNTPALAINAAIMRNLTFRPVEDLAAVSKLCITPTVLAVTPNFPARNIQELIALAKQNPGRYSFASSGPATSLHLAGELLKSMAGIDLMHVPYRGGAPALIDIMAGEPQMMFNPVIGTLPFLRDGRLRALAVSTLHRSPALPDVPTIAESGVPGYDFSLWYGLFAPRATPPDIVAQISRTAHEALFRPAVHARMVASGVEVVGSTPEEFTADLQGEVRTWTELAHRIGLSVD